MSFIDDPLRYLGSFAGEQRVDVYKSLVGPDIEVSLINGRYQLNAGCVNYSYGPLHDAFRRYFAKDKPRFVETDPILILGFGGGSVAVILREELGFNNPVTGVELDEAVLNAAYDHFNIDRLKNLEIVRMDAHDYINTCQQKFALIVIDLYVDEFVPPVFESTGFLQRVHNCLLPGGKVVFNKLESDEKTCGERIALETIFNNIFARCITFKIPVNKQSPNYMITGFAD
ncbi:MAG: methyltransferase domain-containing protein [Lentimicrobiaceae bacterium]|nr:methyltransferase domain-containing protein [Lentimicrobiaceae bacterium]MCB9023526.1 methyltransferase domain-containing protein [Lentimicrobiaceae bacterium]MCO5266601.1 methyltransferase domain-containing protein [Lentimicrobium sp.]